MTIARRLWLGFGIVILTFLVAPTTACSKRTSRAICQQSAELQFQKQRTSRSSCRV